MPEPEYLESNRFKAGNVALDSLFPIKRLSRPKRPPPVIMSSRISSQSSLEMGPPAVPLGRGSICIFGVFGDNTGCVILN